MNNLKLEGKGNDQDEEMDTERPFDDPFTIMQYQFMLPSTVDSKRDILCKRTHFNKKEGDFICIELHVNSSNCERIKWSSEMEISVKDSAGKLMTKHSFTDIFTKSNCSFEVKELVNISNLAEGNYTLYLRKGDKETYISEITIVELPFPYTEYTQLNGFALFRLKDGDNNDNILEITERGTQSCFDFDKFTGVLVVISCCNVLNRSYDYQFVTRIYNGLGILVFENEAHGRVRSNREDADNYHLTYQSMETEIDWAKGSYKIEVELFGEIIVMANFVVGDRDVRSTYNNNTLQPKINIIIPEAKDLMSQLNSMIGLKGIKDMVAQMVSKVKFDDKRRRNELPTKPIQLHCAFLGNSGTGKASVAKILGQIYKDLGLLSKGHVVLDGRAILMNRNGGAGECVNKAIERANGGILFIAEAHDLITDHLADSGKLILSEILSALDDESKGDWVLIMAGCPKQMDNMLNKNPDLRSRLKRFHFSNYDQEELMQVGDLWLNKNCYTMSDDARLSFSSLISTAVSQRNEYFGNARFVFNLLENEIQPAMATRVLSADTIDSKELLTTIEKCDIPNPNEESDSKDILIKLNSMVGLSELKTTIDKHLSFVRFINARRDSNIFTAVPPMHMIFTGNPGTGKTCVANYLGEIYRSMGLLSVGNVIRVTRSDIVGSYIGHTEKKMVDILSAAEGNILFIDEAYTLFSSADQNDFGKKAIEVLLDTLSRESLDMVVIIAGYPKEMEQLLCSNPGLKGRFPYNLHFDDYSEDELLLIAKDVVVKSNLILSQEAEEAVIAIIKKEYRTKDANFSNARFVVRLITTQVMLNMAHRIMALEKRDEVTLKTIIAEDVHI